MRLLNVEGVDRDRVKLESFRPPYPQYLILSHTWSQNPDEEVLFRDVHDGKLHYLKKRAWSEKVKGFCTIAKLSGYTYVWIDTCCIDKADNTELTEAINRMYAWYQSAAACFVYLQDVRRELADLIFKFAKIYKSKPPRWFTRGWTLQELVAPKILYFFDKDWHRLGSRSELARAVRAFTGIPSDVLHGRDPYEYPLHVRCSWAKGRETTKEEDQVYSLIGLLGIDMIVVYGITAERAQERLEKAVRERYEGLSSGSEAIHLTLADRLRQIESQYLC